MIPIKLNTLPGLESLPDAVMVRGNPHPVPFSPPIGPDHVFSVDVVRPILGWMLYDSPDMLLLFGDRGSGKSSTLRQFHAYLNLPMFSVSGHKRLEWEDLLGVKEIVDGDTITMDGPLTQAWRVGATFLFEEIDRAPEETSIGLNPILDGYPLINVLNGGEVIPRIAGARCAATANTNGSGDVRGEYNTANILDQSLMDRMQAVRVDYPTPEQEFALLKKKLGDAIPDAMLNQSISMANDIRFLHAGKTDRLSGHVQASMAPTMETTLSTRSLLRLWNLVILYAGVEKPLFYALDIAVTNKCSEVCAEAIKKIAEAHFAGGASP